MLYAIPNLTSQSAFALEEPWAYVPKDLPPKGLTKEGTIQWASGSDIEYAAISGYEGTTDTVRISSENPAHMLHAFVVDYDLPLSDDAVERIKTTPVCEFKPAYVSRTASGNARLVWLLEDPFLCGTPAHMKAFLKTAAKHMKLNKWLGGFDVPAFGDAARYFMLGEGWEPLFPEYRVPTAHLQLWFFKAASGMKLDGAKNVEYNIPMEDLEREVHAKYPGRWTGAFVQSARGTRFWDASADNPTAAMVTPDGMVCFTGDQFFVPWKQLFGAAFVDNYEASYIAEVVDNCVYDGREFWMEDDGMWLAWNKQDFTQELRCKGKNGARKPGQTMSEIDLIENSIKKTRRVNKVLPFLYHAPGRIRYNNEPYLNIATVKTMSPAAPEKSKLSFSDGRKHFPFIYKLLVNMFTDENVEDSEQLNALLAWTKHFYVNSFERTPKSGHLLIIAGPAGKGKSMFVNEILGRLMGNAPVDGTGLLLEGEAWTHEIVESPIMLIDDAVATTDYRGMKKFTARIKKYVANSKMTWTRRYKDGGAVPWFGRIVILCNTDPESLKILPDPDSSTLDKFSMFKASEAKIKFPDREEITRLVGAELPHFARFLLDWSVPQRWEAEETRFGVRPFHHPDLLDESRQQGVGTILELLDGFMEVYTATRPDQQEWVGTASHLFEDLCAYRPEFMRTMKERSLATQLGILMKNGYSIGKAKNERGIQEWTIAKHVTVTLEEEDE